MSGVRLAYAGGGSGGDAYPLLTVARAIEARRPGSAHLFFATEEGLGANIYREAGFEVAPVSARRLVLRNLPLFPFSLAAGLRVARARLAAFAPGLLLAIGGFVSPPVVLAARSLGVPVFLLEPNSVAGRANRLLAHFAERVVTAYPSAATTLPDPARAERLGLPLRHRLDEVRRRELCAARPAGERCLTVTGGSLGARVLNRSLQALYPELAGRAGLRVVHVTGRGQHAEAREAWRAAGEPVNIELRGYEEDMERLYLEADRVVCRAGATTCHELATFRTPALVVPLAMAPSDHQYRNARPLEAAGLVEIVREPDFGADRLRDWIDAWLEGPADAPAPGEGGELPLRLDGAERVAERLLERLEAGAGDAAPAGGAAEGAGCVPLPPDRPEGGAARVAFLASIRGGGGVR